VEYWSHAGTGTGATRTVKNAYKINGKLDIIYIYPISPSYFPVPYTGAQYDISTTVNAFGILNPHISYDNYFVAIRHYIDSVS